MLEINNLSLGFLRYSKNFFKKENLRIISNFNLSVKKGEIVAIIGSSGAGKSLLAHSILGILPKNANISGEMKFNGKILTESKKKKLRGKKIVLIPQSINFLNPLISVGTQVYRAAFNYSKNKKESELLKEEAFKIYNLSDNVKKQYPFQVSGGMARRVLTAIATVSNASLIIADEPTTGLDPKAIDESLSYLKKIAAEGKGIILITHDINYALKYADKIAVFYGGSTVEIALPSDFEDKSMLRHPYTKALFDSLPKNEFSFIPGFNPFGEMLPDGCVFHSRCKNSIDVCKSTQPELKIKNNGKVWCHNA